MQKYLIGIIFFLVSFAAQANLPPLTQDPMTNNVVSSMNAAPATQMYQSVDDPAPQQIAPKAPAVKKATPVQKVAVVDKQQQAQQAQLSAQVQDLESRLTQFTQSYLLAQQESKQELALLGQKSAALQAEIEQLLIVLKTVSQQVDQVKMQIAGQQKQLGLLSNGSSWQSLVTKLQAYVGGYNNTLLLLIVLVLLIIWWLVIRLRKQRAKIKVVQNQHEDDDTKNEYDFMGSSEGIPAQLDLARAYIAMENYTAAEGVLHQVLAKGDAAQQQEAQDLLAKIPKA
ncbi:MAG TPA: FimV/HubP family polar landmark protein [Coxiellaceae bacterium]|nr:FimV/HubP family polar landmark protein [Coxiellaceae bacterium]